MKLMYVAMQDADACTQAVSCETHLVPNQQIIKNIQNSLYNDTSSRQPYHQNEIQCQTPITLL